MICDSCKRAGEVNAAYLEDGDKNKLQFAIDLHSRCQVGCFCQHITGIRMH